MTPETIDQDVQRLLARIGAAEAPVYLTVRPEPYAAESECIAAVAEKIRHAGGSQVMGWQIWKGLVIVEAELHAVWRSPDGALHEVTPKPAGITQILFVPDPRQVYAGAQIDNIRLNISGNLVGDDFIRATEGLFRLMNKGERALSKEVQLSDDELELAGFLTSVQAGTMEMVIQSLPPTANCLCGSGQSYGDCHRLQLNDALDAI